MVLRLDAFDRVKLLKLLAAASNRKFWLCKTKLYFDLYQKTDYILKLPLNPVLTGTS